MHGVICAGVILSVMGAAFFFYVLCAPHPWPVCLVCAGTEWLVPKSPVAFHTLGLGLLPVCIHSFSALRCSIPSGSVCLRCVGGDDDHDHHHRRTQKAAIIAFGKAMRAEATIPPFPSLGKGRGDGWPSRHQRRSCRSTLMAASPQPSLAPMKAGVASPLPSPSPSLADANSGKVGRAAESKESHFATLGLAPAAAAPLGQLRRLWCQAKVAKGGPTPPQILSWRGLRQLGFGGGGGPAALSSPSLAREGGRGGGPAWRPGK